MRKQHNFTRHVLCILSCILLISFSIVPIHYTENAYSAPVEIAKEGKNTAHMKWAFLSAAIATGMSTIGAAIAVGLVGSSAMGALSEKPEMAGRALIFVGLAEGIAIYGLIVSIMILGMV
jgi:V/A-type H+-transporting ATPase subunit K